MKRFMPEASETLPWVLSMIGSSKPESAASVLASAEVI
jgi:hypothetical protein